MTQRRTGRHRGHTPPAMPTPTGRLALAAVSDEAAAAAAEMCDALGMPRAYARHLAAAIIMSPRLQNRAEADRVTAQEAARVLAVLEHPCPDPATCNVEMIRDAYVSDLLSECPDVDPVHIGRVVMHAASMAGRVTLALRDLLPVNQDATESALGLLSGAGSLLYLGASRPATDGGTE